MLTVSNVSLSFGGRKLFDEVNVKFTPGNCYGVIGANGAGKSSFFKVLSGELESQTGSVEITPGERMSVLKQKHDEYDEFTVLQTVLKGNEKLYQIIQEKDALYAKEDFSDEDGLKAAELEAEFAELNGWEAESEAETLLLGLGVSQDIFQKPMKDLSGNEKVKILLGQALFGNPDILLLDEPTNDLDTKAIRWLENFLMDFQKTLLVISHDRHFLNKVCTHIADIDFKKITIYSGNYDFWRKSSELAQRLRSDQKKKAEDKAKELKTFIQRFSANASKSSQATSRQKQLEKLELEDLPLTTRKYPFIQFEPIREVGKEVLRVENLSLEIEGEKIFSNINFTLQRDDKLLITAKEDIWASYFYQVLMGEVSPTTGSVEWGVTTKPGYFPSNNSPFFENNDTSIVDWLRDYCIEDQTENYVRSYLGKMLFSKDEALKKVKVLSGGEKVRCMLCKMMVEKSNVLLLDNPTHHLDLESITSLNEGLERFPHNIIFSSFDQELCQSLATRIIEISPKGMIYDKHTDYESYLLERN